MLIWTILLASALPQSDPTQLIPDVPLDASPAPAYAEPDDRLPINTSVPPPHGPYSVPYPGVNCPTCPHDAPMFTLSQPMLPSVMPAPVATVAAPAPATAIVAPVSPFCSRVFHPYGAYPIIAVTPYSFERYPIYTYPCLPHKFNDLRVRSKWRMSPGNMFPPVADQPAAHGYYYFKPYNYGMVPYQQYASQRWGQPASQPYLGPLQDDLAARAASFHTALSGHAPTWTPTMAMPPALPPVIPPTLIEQDAASGHFRQERIIGNPYPSFP